MLPMLHPAFHRGMWAAPADASESRNPPVERDEVVVRLRLVGQMEAWATTGESVLPSLRRARAVLAVLALAAPRPVLRPRIADLVWNGRGDEQARGSLRQEVHRLLEAMAPAGREVLQVTRGQLALRSSVIWSDVGEILQATPERPGALALLDGELLEGLDGINPAFDLWLKAERDRLRDHARSVAESLLLAPAASEPRHAIRAAEQLLRIDRTHEGAWRVLMRAHAARGERGMAIQTYDRCRLALGEVLDALPSAETEELLAALRGTVRAVSSTTPSVAASGAASEEPALRADDRLAVGVAPLRQIGKADGDPLLAASLAEEIALALSRFRWLSVAWAQSVGRVIDAGADEIGVRRSLGIDYLLDGTVQQVGSRVRLTLRLVDLRTASQVVWARRQDRQGGHGLFWQEQVAAEVAAQLDAELLQAEARRAAGVATPDASAQDLTLRAIPLIGQMERPAFLRAGQLLAMAVRRDPENAGAHAWYAYWHIFLVGQDWADDPAAMMAEAGRLAERATALDPFDARGLAIAGHVRAFLHRQVREAAELHERALALNPHMAMAWALSAVTRAYLGELDEAGRRAEQYKRLLPLDPHAFFFDAFFVLIHLLRRDHEAAVRMGRTVSTLNGAFSASLKPYLAALGHLGLIQDAAAVRGQLRVVEPGFTVARFLATTALRREEDRRHMAEGLRLAGVPESD